jgi:cytosolic carboxypeptidase protein 2/3
LVTARVHPSETSSSFFTEGLIEYLLGDSKASCLLREMFIFQIIPMLNPDGVEHGNFRFDHEMRNLNRYYGQSSIDKTYLLFDLVLPSEQLSS